MFLLWFDGLVRVLSAELGDGEGAARVGDVGLAGLKREGLGVDGLVGYCSGLAGTGYS